MHIRRLIVLIIFSLLLFGCGGGGGDSTSETSDSTVTEDLSGTGDDDTSTVDVNSSDPSATGDYDLTKLYSKSMKFQWNQSRNTNIGSIDEEVLQFKGMTTFHMTGKSKFNDLVTDRLVMTDVSHLESISVSIGTLTYLLDGFPVAWENDRGESCQISSELLSLPKNARVGYKSTSIDFDCSQSSKMYQIWSIEQNSDNKVEVKIFSEDDDWNITKTYQVDSAMNILDYSDSKVKKDGSEVDIIKTDLVEHVNRIEPQTIDFESPLATYGLPQDETVVQMIFHPNTQNAYMLTKIDRSNAQRFYTLDVSDPENVTRIGSAIEITSGKLGYYQGMMFSKDLEKIYLNSKIFLTIIDISEPSDPIETATSYFQIGENISIAISKDDSKLYIGAAGGLIIYDISDLSKPNPLSVLTLFSGQIVLSDDEKTIYSAGILGSGLDIIDVSDPLKPSIVSNLKGSLGIGNIFADRLSISSDETTAYLLHDSSNTNDLDLFMIVDISDKLQPKLLGTTSSIERQYLVNIMKGVSYRFSGENKVEIVDISDPSNIRFIDFHRFNTSQLNALSYYLWSIDGKNIYQIDQDKIRVY